MKVDDLKRMRAAGMGRIAISRIYGCEPSTVRSWLVRFGLPTSNPLKEADPEAINQAIATRLALPGNPHGAN